MYYVDHTRPPWVDIALPPAIILPATTLITLYAVVLGLDYSLLSNERYLRKYISATQLRIGMALMHIILPMIFISNHPPCNILFAAGPWFIASYAAHMPTDTLTFKKCVYDLFKVTIQDDKDTDKAKIRYKGVAKVSLGVFKLIWMRMFINPLLPVHPDDALEYAWLHPMSLIYTILFGIKAYCLLGAVDIFMGLEQTLFAWNMVDLFDSPILATSPRDFWRDGIKWFETCCIHKYFQAEHKQRKE
ncbi:uncharacterized protein EV154DRAFT_285389 [Mucor mucedo]|uniref:uncharacterized protein n=1 Tax=Mucor mucedo TaxID=29922 RepID=UPI0022209AED|nr:uncharacterized protein EV154DRAFT_285389 [Mucor mucedo]KAI7889390.1 hypothetical protein EV154DRAFT_285389 [Mucor mucedo]